MTLVHVNERLFLYVTSGVWSFGIQRQARSLSLSALKPWRAELACILHVIMAAC